MQLLILFIPLAAIVLAAAIKVARHGSEEPIGRVPMFFIWLAAYSMCAVAFGLGGIVVVSLLFSGIPGTASAGGEMNGEYYFSWHDDTYTQVSGLTWHGAFFLEQLAFGTLWVASGVFVISIAIFFLVQRVIT